MKWEYKIVKSWLGYNIYRKKEDWLNTIEWLQNWAYTLNRGYAKTFYHLDDAIWALVQARVIARKWIDTTSTKKSESEGHKEKTS